MDTLGPDFDSLLTRGAVVSLLAAAAWAATVVVAVAVEARTDGRIRLAGRVGCPPVLRAWLLGILTVLLTSVAPAHAGDAGAGAGTSVDAALDGLPLPDRPTGSPRPTTHPGVVVVTGDSLWRIARARVAADATDVDVAATVAVLYAANRDVIGPDPDRLRPGQHLVFPALPAYSEEP